MKKAILFLFLFNSIQLRSQDGKVVNLPFSSDGSVEYTGKIAFSGYSKDDAYDIVLKWCLFTFEKGKVIIQDKDNGVVEATGKMMYLNKGRPHPLGFNIKIVVNNNECEYKIYRILVANAKIEALLTKKKDPKWQDTFQDIAGKLNSKGKEIENGLTTSLNSEHNQQKIVKSEVIPQQSNGSEKEQKGKDVLFFKNGNVIKGTIIEINFGKNVKIKTSDGSILTFKQEELSKITKE